MFGRKKVCAPQGRCFFGLDLRGSCVQGLGILSRALSPPETGSELLPLRADLGSVRLTAGSPAFLEHLADTVEDSPPLVREPAPGADPCPRHPLGFRSPRHGGPSASLATPVTRAQLVSKGTAGYRFSGPLPCRGGARSRGGSRLARSPRSRELRDLPSARGTQRLQEAGFLHASLGPCHGLQVALPLALSVPPMHHECLGDSVLSRVSAVFPQQPRGCFESRVSASYFPMEPYQNDIPNALILTL